MPPVEDQAARALYGAIENYLHQQRIWYNPVARGAIEGPAVWRPHLDPPRLLYWDDLSDREGALAFAHELGHVILHSPGSPDPGMGHESESEERIVHAAAAVLWAHAGLTEYEQGMAAMGVPRAMLSPQGGECLAADRLGQEMINLLFG